MPSSQPLPTPLKIWPAPTIRNSDNSDNKLKPDYELIR